MSVITNALDAMPNGGTSTITNQSTTELLEIDFKDTGRHVPRINEQTLYPTIHLQNQAYPSANALWKLMTEKSQ